MSSVRPHVSSPKLFSLFRYLVLGRISFWKKIIQYDLTLHEAQI